MSSQDIDFIRGYSKRSPNREKQELSLCHAYPVIHNDEKSDILTRDHKSPRNLYENNTLVEDGLYASNNPFVYNVFKPYEFSSTKILEYQSKHKFSGKLLEIAVREIKIHTAQSESNTTIEIGSVSILFKNKVICKTKSPFNRKLHKLLIRNSECNNLAIQVHAQDGQSSILPLPLPKRSVKDSKTDIDFAISDNSGRVHAGTVMCTISLSSRGSNQRDEHTAYIYKLSNDPNDPQNSLSLLRPQKSSRKEQVKYFVLEHPALTFNIESEAVIPQRVQREEEKAPDTVIMEQPAFSLLNISFRNLFQARRPLKPSSSTHRHHIIGRSVLTVTVFRGVEIPLREESALVQPLVEIEWGSTVHTTSIADGPAPIWQQTMHFELPRQNGDHCVKLRLYDQHPVWGQQWLGEARIPLEHHRSYQELERWIVLSPLFSPVLSFGYVQASPGQSHTRIYVLIKMERPGNSQTMESSSVNTLLKGIQRCLAIPYQINGVENPEEAARLTKLLPSLPNHFGPITPRQALNIKKVDHYGRAALLAALLQGFGLQTYVLLGSSQVSKWTAFVLSIDQSNTSILWDPEFGTCYSLSDSRSSLMKVSRLVNHIGVWENLQKSILPHNLKYDTKSSKDWRPLDPIIPTPSNRTVQTLDLSITDEEEQQIRGKAVEMEQSLKDKLSQWRTMIGLTTIFNRHAITVLRNFISKIESSSKQHLDKRDLKQIHRAYHTHGFVLNLRKCTLDDLDEQLSATKIHTITGPVEFALVCQIQPYVGKICSIWLAVLILRSRD